MQKRGNALINTLNLLLSDFDQVIWIFFCPSSPSKIVEPISSKYNKGIRITNDGLTLIEDIRTADIDFWSEMHERLMDQRQIADGF